MMPPAPKLYLIDGHSLAFKAYYAIRQGLTSPDGRPTGAVYGFLRMLLKCLDDWKPDRLAVVFDAGKPTFRKELYDAYKANRQAPPADFPDQMRWIFELLRAMGLAMHQMEGFEADDLIATMAEQAKAQGHEVLILTADKDLFQLVDDRVTVLRPAPNEPPARFDVQGVIDKLGARPDQVVDWLALVGDASDNVPGVPGIGEKTATALLREFGTLEALLERADEIERPRQRQALVENAERARLAQRLVTLRRDVPMAWSLEACRVPEDLFPDEARRLLARLGFNSILKERGIESPSVGGAKKSEGPERFERFEGFEEFAGFEGAIGTGQGQAGPQAEQADYRAIANEAELARWVEQAMRASWMALDTETTSIDVMRARLVGISLSHAAGKAVYLPLGHETQFADGGQMSLEATRRILKPLLAGQGPRLVGHHAKFDWKMLDLAGFGPLVPPAFDTMIASYLLDPDKASGHGLKALGQELLGIAMAPIADLIGKGREVITMAEVDVARATDYACRDADVTLRLMALLRERLGAIPDLARVMETIELPLIPVLMAMELGGFRVDVATLRELGGQLEARQRELTQAIYEAAGRQFNVASTRQVAQVLYEELGLRTGRKGKTGYSTDEAELERLSPLHPVPRLILEYRASEKLLSTYIDALPRMVVTRTGRVHATFHQTTAATGRLSSTDPNLQNIPIRTEMGRAIRRAFVADGPDHILLKADYSQIELRILAHASGDAALCEAYRQGRDIHKRTAGEVFGVEPEQVTGQMRAEAKVINFGIIYGMSPHGLAAQLGIGRAKAAQFIDRYFNTYPGVRAWIDRTLAQARRDGWVRTLAGRRRLVPEVNEKNRMAREAAERVAVNTPIQGTCADMIKLAMIQIHRRLGEVAPGGRLVCQVHDELVFSLPKDRIEPATAMIQEEMIQALPLSVPVEVQVGVAPNWAEC
jgi:DNA polymerase-1